MTTLTFFNTVLTRSLNRTDKGQVVIKDKKKMAKLQRAAFFFSINDGCRDVTVDSDKTVGGPLLSGSKAV